MHPRALIRKKVVELLLCKTSAGLSVYPSRIAPLLANDFQNDLPAICVYTMDDNGEIFNAAPREYLRTVEVVVEVVASANSELDDLLDAIARQVEQLLLADDTLGGLANDFTYNRTRVVMNEDGERPIGGCRVIFDAEYLDRHPDDFFNESLPAFNTLSTQYSLNNAQTDPADRAQTIIEGINT